MKYQCDVWNESEKQKKFKNIDKSDAKEDSMERERK